MIINMHQVNISGIDLNLVPALDALLRLRNVTRAAEEVGLSQPAMSRALSRLRDLHRDPLLVRTGTGYALTPKARALQPQLNAAVRSLRDVFQQQTFDPGMERRTLRVAATDAQATLLAPALMRRLAVEAPGVDLRIEGYGANLLDRFDNGTLDLAFALSSTPLPAGAYSEVVLQDRLALVMRRAHPAARRKWSIADYGKYNHVGVAVIGDGQSEMDALLAAKGVTRRIALVTPSFVAALAAVAQTDMVTTLSAALARRFAKPFDLIVKAPPVGDDSLTMTLVSSHVRAQDPLLVWFRNLVRQVATAAST
jgi:DNA-binding transcriptional LysR family regulator